MLSVRMRASGKVRGEEVHISGAEGIYSCSRRLRVIEEYIDRALRHSRGKPDRIVITMESIGKPRLIRSLPVTTLKCCSVSDSEKHVTLLLRNLGVSVRALRAALHVTRNDNAMRGAALMFALSGRRAEQDRRRGVRASRLGITDRAGKSLSRQLAKEGIDTVTVKEAVILASKVAACKDVVAELCLSDDPHYTTGYVASRRFGYVRIPQMKKKRSKRGGRVFFLKEGADVSSVIGFLEEKAVLVNSVGECRGVRSIDEIVNSLYR